MPVMEKIREPILSSEARSTNGASNTSLCSDTDHADFICRVSAKSGTTPKLNIKIQSRYDSTDDWLDVPGASFPEITTSGDYYITVTSGLLKYARASYTITGTDASFTFSLLMIKRNKF